MTKLPNSWEVKKLEELCNIQIGKTPPRKNPEFFLGDNLWLSIRDLKEKHITTSNEKITNEAIANSNMKIVPKGTLLMSFKLTLGKTAFAGCDLYTNEAIVALFVKNSNKIDKFFLEYALNYADLEKYVDNAVKGKTLNQQKLKQIQIPLPSLEEQKKIVKILDKKFASIDESIRLAKVDLLSLDELWQSILNDSFNPLKSKLDNDTYTLPPTWKWEKLGDIAQVVTGTTPSKKKEEFYGVGYPLFKPSDLDDGYELFSGSDNLTPLGFENARQFPINTTLVVCIGATIGKVGLTRVEGSCNQQINAILPNENFNSEYLYFLCLSPYFQMILKANASQTTLPIINKTEFIKLQIPLPPLKEQERITKELESKAKTIKELKELYVKRLKDYEELKESLLDLVFKGGL